MALRAFSELSTGKTYPPSRERVRVQEQDVWFARYSRQFADDTKRIKPNTYRFICGFYQDQVISIPPTFSYDGDARQQELVKLIAPSVVNSTREVICDLIRYGSGVYTNNIPWNVGNVDPRYYFAVYRPELNEYLGAITVQPWIDSPDNAQPDRIAISGYQQGTNISTTRFYKLDGLTIGGSVADPVERPAMQPILVTHGQGSYGTSWFQDVDEYIVDLSRRESAVSVALDKHTNPHLALPEGATRTDAQGRQTVFQDGMVIPIPEKTDIAPQYIVWNAKFEAQHEAMERAIERIQRHVSIARYSRRTASCPTICQAGAHCAACRSLRSVVSTHFGKFSARLCVSPLPKTQK